MIFNSLIICIHKKVWDDLPLKYIYILTILHNKDLKYLYFMHLH